MNIYLDLFLTFARIGGFTFGGGYAMLPMLQAEVVEKKKWATEEELMDYYAIGQCTPGIIAVNTATFIGYKTKGIPGGIIATLGVVAPSIVIITVISMFLRHFAEYEIVQHACRGITICVCMLILQAVLKLAKKSLTDKIAVALFAVILAVSLVTDVSTYILVVAAGILGWLIYPRGNKEKGGKKA